MARARDIADHGYIYTTPNLLINPQFEVNQRGWVNGSNLVSIGDYARDRWCAAIANSAPTVSGDILTIPSGDAIKQIVEALNIPNGIYTISWQGTSQVSIDGGAAQNSPYTFSVSSGSNVEVTFGAGTLQQPMLVVGAEAKPFQKRHIAEEIALCQRYYEADLRGTAVIWYGFTGTGNLYYTTIRFNVLKRITPTMVRVTESLNGFGSVSFGGITTTGFYAYATCSAGLATGYFYASWTADAEL